VLSAKSIGGVSTVEVTTEPVKATLLKRALFSTTSDELCYALTLGPILRNFGTYAGDLTPEVLGITLKEFKELSIEARWDRFCRSVIAGLVHEPSSPVVDALRYRFAGGRIIAAVGNDAKFKQDTQNSSTDRSKRSIPLSEYITRYGGFEHEWEDFCERIRTMEYGEIIQHRVMSLICSVDYGVKLPDPTEPPPGQVRPDVYTPEQRERARIARVPVDNGVRALVAPLAFVPAVVPVAAVVHPAGVDAQPPIGGVDVDTLDGSETSSSHAPGDGSQEGYTPSERTGTISLDPTDEPVELYFGDYHLHANSGAQLEERRAWRDADRAHRGVFLLETALGQMPLAMGFRSVSGDSAMSDLTESEAQHVGSKLVVNFGLPRSLPSDPLASSDRLCGGVDSSSEESAEEQPWDPFAGVYTDDDLRRQRKRLCGFSEVSSHSEDDFSQDYSVDSSVLREVRGETHAADDGSIIPTDIVGACNGSASSVHSDQASHLTELTLSSSYTLTNLFGQDSADY